MKVKSIWPSVNSRCQARSLSLLPQLAFEHFQFGQHPGLLSGGDSARGPSERPETGPRPSAAVVSATVSRTGRILVWGRAGESRRCERRRDPTWNNCAPSWRRRAGPGAHRQPAEGTGRASAAFLTGVKPTGGLRRSGSTDLGRRIADTAHVRASTVSRWGWAERVTIGGRVCSGWGWRIIWSR